MKRFSDYLGTLISNDRGGETVEYVLILGLLVLAALAVMSNVGLKVMGRWTSLNGEI